MDDDIKAYCRKQIEQLTAGNVYCDLILSAGEATALQQLVNALRASEQHQVLDRVFRYILEEIEQAQEHPDVDQAWPTI